MMRFAILLLAGATLFAADDDLQGKEFGCSFHHLAPDRHPPDGVSTSWREQRSHQIRLEQHGAFAWRTVAVAQWRSGSPVGARRGSR